MFVRFTHVAGSNRRRTKQLLFAGVVGLFSFIVLLLSPDIEGAGVSLCIVLTGFVVASYLWPFGYNRSCDASDPVFLGGIIVLAGFVMRTFLLIDGNISNGLDVATRSAFGINFDVYYLYGLFFGFIYWSILLLGYKINWYQQQPRVSKPLPDIGPFALLTTIAFLSVIGWTCRIYTFLVLPARFDTYAEANYSPLATLASQLGFLATAGVVLSLVYYQKHKTRLMIGITVLLVFAECFYSLPSGSRTQLFAVLVILLSWLGMRQPIRVDWRALVGGAVALYIIGFMVMYRLVSSEGNGAREFISRVSNTVAQAGERGPFGVVEQALFNISYRFHGLDSLTSILMFDVGASYGWGSVYLFKTMAPLVPRFLWPNKPQETAGQELAQTYFQVPPENGVFYAPTWMGDLSLQFPPEIVILVFFLLGIVLQSIRRLAISVSEADEPTIGQFFYLLIIPPFVITDGWLHVALYETVRALMAGFGILLIFRLFRIISRGEYPFALLQDFRLRDRLFPCVRLGRRPRADGDGH